MLHFNLGAFCYSTVTFGHIPCAVLFQQARSNVAKITQLSVNTTSRMQ